MKPDYAKATAELLERLRKRKANENVNPPSQQSQQVYINSPRNCVIVISPCGQAPGSAPPECPAPAKRNPQAPR